MKRGGRGERLRQGYTHTRSKTMRSCSGSEGSEGTVMGAQNIGGNGQNDG
jgi:hypothetical protein